MDLNSIKPAAGSRRARHRVGRGIGSGWGKTAGRGHKGQRARSGGFHKIGFEGGQMPLQRRLPKRGFNSPMRDDTAEVRLSDIERMQPERIDLAALREAGVVPPHCPKAKIILNGRISRKVHVTGIGVSKGARAAIEAAGGTVELPEKPKVEAKPEQKPAPKPEPKAEEAAPKREPKPDKPKSEAKSGAKDAAQSKPKPKKA